MIVTPLPVEISLPPSRTVRSKGIHVSNIIRCMATEQGILKPEWAEELSLVDAREITDPVAVLRIRMGLAWEEHYIPTLEGVVDHPGEMKVNGIYMTHDAESLDVIITADTKLWAIIIHEVKCTYKSTNTVKDLHSQWMWLAQCMAYCKGAGTRFAMMHVLFVCGDYSYPIRPILRKWLIEFTQEEVDGNWDLLRDYRDSRIQEIHQHELESRIEALKLAEGGSEASEDTLP